MIQSKLDKNKARAGCHNGIKTSKTGFFLFLFIFGKTCKIANMVMSWEKICCTEHWASKQARLSWAGNLHGGCSWRRRRRAWGWVVVFAIGTCTFAFCSITAQRHFPIYDLKLVCKNVGDNQIIKIIQTVQKVIVRNRTWKKGEEKILAPPKMGLKCIQHT